MLAHVRIDVRVPADADRGMIRDLQAREQEQVRELRRAGKWLHIWRIPGRWSNVSVLEVGDAEELHGILMGLPLRAYMDVEVTLLARHPVVGDIG